MTQEKQSKLNAVLLSFIGIVLTVMMAMMGFFMNDFSSWKSNVIIKLDNNKDRVIDHINDELIKNQDQDIMILNNKKDILRLQEENKLAKERLNKGGL